MVVDSPGERTQVSCDTRGGLGMGRVCPGVGGPERHGAFGSWARVTCREGELDLLLDHLKGHKVMLLVEAPVV